MTEFDSLEYVHHNAQLDLGEKNLIREELVNRVDGVIRKFQDGEITDLFFVGELVRVWDEAWKDPIISDELDRKCWERIDYFQDIARVDIRQAIHTLGDIYCPFRWPITIPKEFANNSGKIV